MRIVLAFICCALCGAVEAQSELPRPARIVTAYAFTSTLDNAFISDPADWALLGSNDGQSWTELDVRTNQISVSPGGRRLYRVRNTNAYSFFRLRIDGNARGTPRQVGLAEMELLGPAVGVEDEDQLEAVITSSQEYPLMGSAISAWDGDLTTKWRDYAPLNSGECWIQCEYRRNPQILLTNAGQLRIAAQLLGPKMILLENAPIIRSNLLATSSQIKRTLTGYAITSANDFPVRDPRDWTLLGSNDGGKTWDEIDIRRNEMFSTRFHKRTFQLSRPATYALFRLNIENRDWREMQIAELEPLYADSFGADELTLVLSANNENLPLEQAERAFDANPRTKWLSYTTEPGQATNYTLWIQWQYLTRMDELPEVNLLQLNRLTRRGKGIPVPDEGTPRILHGYAVTSANDAPERDPTSWQLLGSRDSGETWDILDTRRDEVFSNRFQRLEFRLDKPARYPRYKIVFESVLEPSEANGIQIAELEPLFDPAGRQKGLVISAQGEYAPVEQYDKAFDGRPDTKWFEFSHHPSKASWIEWYVTDQTSGIIRSDAARGIPPRLPQHYNLQLEGVVVYARSNRLGILESTGFEVLEFDRAVDDIDAGQRIRVIGRIRFRKDITRLEKATFERLAALSSEGASWHEQFATGTVEGQVTATAEGPGYTTVKLIQDQTKGEILVRIINPGFHRLPDLTGNRIRARGVWEPMLDPKGKWFHGALWVEGDSGFAILSGGAVASYETDSGDDLPHLLITARDVRRAIQVAPEREFRVHLRGVVTYVDLGFNSWYLQDETDSVLVEQGSAGILPNQRQEGLQVQLDGYVGGQYGSSIVATNFVKILGRSRMPEPLRRSFDSLITGNDDNKWVAVQGIVTAFDRQRLTLSMNGGNLVAWVNNIDQTTQDRMLGSLVRVSGVCAPIFNFRGNRLGVRLLVPSAEHVEILRRIPENPFNLPNDRIDRILRLGFSGLRAGMVKVTGVVTYRDPNTLFIQDNDNGVKVILREKAAVAVGDRVEVVGIPMVDGLSPKMVQAVVRKLGAAPLPESQSIELVEMSNDGIRGHIEAVLVGRSASESLQVLELKQDQFNRTFPAYFPVARGELESIPLGSRLRVTGVFKGKTDDVPDEGQVITSFEMFANGVQDITILERPPWWTSRYAVWVLGGLGSVLFLVLAWVALLRREVLRRTRELQAEISERKRMEIEVQNTHKQLLDASRRAGMAEVATSVLHNVGNVLNSANVSANLLMNKLRQSKIARLEKLSEMFAAQKENLGSFLTEDSRGRQVPEYLAQLSGILKQEHSALFNEADSLGRNIEHIKEIVSMQQNYASISGVRETMSISEVIEDALRLNSSAICRKDIEIIRDYADLPPVSLDRHKVLQILVNLLSNAKQACESMPGGRQIHIRTTATENKMLRVEVSDNGMGISPENLKSIFRQGFTTKRNGHGFGLHGSALAAKEMRGSLTVHSDGLGMGARFSLELPLITVGSETPKNLATAVS